MATLLYRLGRFSFRHSWRVIGVWLLLLVATLGGGIALGGQSQESFVIPGTESQNALDRLEAVFPSVAGASATAVVVAPKGESIEDDKATIDSLVTAIKDVPGIDSVVGPFDEYAGNAVSDDKSMALIKVQFDGPSTDVTDATIADLKDTATIGEDPTSHALDHPHPNDGASHCRCCRWKHYSWTTWHCCCCSRLVAPPS